MNHITTSSDLPGSLGAIMKYYEDSRVRTLTYEGNQIITTAQLRGRLQRRGEQGLFVPVFLGSEEARLAQILSELEGLREMYLMSAY
jgi:pyruvate/2-oxoglutarate dehydrogenase complex dihydrolipoamide acyltransferase (E2) component